MITLRRLIFGLGLLALPVILLALETAPVCGTCHGI